MQVGMELLGAFAGSFPHFVLRDVLVHTENLVIINKCHNSYPPIIFFIILRANYMPNTCFV